SLEWGHAQERGEQEKAVRDQYTKHEYRIPMRDGVHLFTAVYVPKDASKKYPMLMMRTPYSVAPYGPDKYRSSLGPSPHFTREGSSFVYQDARACLVSEGTFVDVRPHLGEKTSLQAIDESSDTHGTIDWLLKNSPNHNGKVGQYGISAPGFYAAAGIV